ncbi:MAG: hypothetical protein GXO73_02425 [Calditrichaeota bacterium]|nr:hypothetical protein [Calditrichota bacterium]
MSTQAATVFTFSFSVKGHHVGSEGWAHPWFVQNVAQDISVAVSEAHGFNSAWYRAARSGWVMRSFEVDYRHPWTLEQDFVAETWISKRTRVVAVRQYLFKDRSSGQPVSGAQAEWVYVDASTTRPIPIPDIFATRYVLDPRTALQSIDPPQDEALLIGRVGFRVRYSDLDMNRHANNVAYIRWATDALQEVGATGRPIWWKIQFKLPAGLAENLEVEVYSTGVNASGAGWQVNILSKDRGATLATARVVTAS